MSDSDSTGAKTVSIFATEEEQEIWRIVANRLGTKSISAAVKFITHDWRRLSEHSIINLDPIPATRSPEPAR